MKLLAILPALLLTGCAYVNNFSYGSWLDRVGSPPSPPVAMPDDAAAQVMQQVVQLRGDAQAVRARLSHEPDRRQRIRYYDELLSINDRLKPLERQLRDAGRSPWAV